MKSHSLKIIFIVIVITVVTLLVSPKIIGSSIEQATVENLITLIPPEAESQVEIRRSEFNNNWFESSALIELIYTPLGAESISVLMDFEIDHGPLLFTPSGPKFGLAFAHIKPRVNNDWFDLAVGDFPFPLPEITLDLLARFNQSLQLAMNVAPIEHASIEGEVSFAGLDASLNTNSDLSANFEMNMGRLSATEVNTGSNLLISGIFAHSTTAQVNDILAASSAELSIPEISSTAPVPFSISGTLIEYGLLTSPSSTEEVEIYQNLSMPNINSNLPLQSIYWSSEVKQLNGELARHYYQLLSDLQGQMSSTPNTATTDINALGQKLSLLLIQNPLEFNNFLKGNAFEGDHSADLRLEWGGLEDLDNFASLDINTALEALGATLDISLDFEAVMRSPFAGLVDPYVQQGYLVVNNGRILIQANFQNGVLHVNGNELPLNQFF
jgi:uncharacterized protein YdgA (DUF945 family)